MKLFRPSPPTHQPLHIILFLLVLFLSGNTSIQAQWVSDATGINHNGNVGIGNNSSSSVKLFVRNYTAARYAGRFDNYSTSTASTAAIYARNTSSASAVKYGVYSFVSTAGTGVNYGVHATATGANNFAGYFNGRGYFSDYVGLGTPTPSERLEVDGNIKISGGTGYGIVFADGTTQTTAATGSSGPDTDWVETATDIHRTTGNIGIGTSTPGHKVDIHENSSFGPNPIVPSSFWHKAHINLHETATFGQAVLLGEDYYSRITFTNNKTSRAWSLEGKPDDDLDNSILRFRFSETASNSLNQYPLTVTARSKVGIDSPNPDAKFEIIENDATATYDLFRIHKNVAPSALGSIDFLTVNSTGQMSVGMYNVPANYKMGIAGAVAIGSITGGSTNWPATSLGYKLAVDGKIICEEIRVELEADWPDYVFSDSYSLMPLDKLEVHITDHKHLPGIPSATTLQEEGLDLGKIQTLQMEKIEELTLYVIQLKKEIEALKKIRNP